MQLESQLHTLGYAYTGGTSLYSLTWIEIMRLIDASHLLEDMNSNIRGGDIDKLDRYHSRVKSKMRQ
jgi:hypothetical protein